VFKTIENEQDRILHNDVMKEIDIMTLPDPIGFLGKVSASVLKLRTKAAVIQHAAKTILQTGLIRKGN
jgi:hypothetical protein